MCTASPLLLISALLALAMAVAVASVQDDSPYCAPRYRRLCQSKGQHVGCQFPYPGPGGACENYSEIKFHDDLKHYITHFINRRRQRIAAGTEKVRGGLYLPKPQVMMMVEWDKELATLAQRLADQCNFVHDDCRATARYPYAGQTVGEVRWRRSSDSDDSATALRAIRRVFDAWWGERRRVQPAQLSAPFRLTAKGAVWGHFSQLAVWSLRAVGCGAVRHGAQHPRLLLVCDFSHTNMLGQRTITPGPLVRCPAHTERNIRSLYPLLCTQVRFRMPPEHFETETEDDVSDEEERPSTTPPSESTATATTSNATERTLRTTTTESTRQMKVTQWRARNPYEVDQNSRRIQHEGYFLHQLDRELEHRQKASSKIMLSCINKAKLNHTPRISNIRHSLEAADNLEESTKDRHKWRNNVVHKSSLITNNSDLYMARHKWRQTRDRPQRPGATALLHITLLDTAQTRRFAFPSLKLDKEDIDQMFKDTGFNPIWLRKSL